MSAFLALIQRDLRISWRLGGGGLLGVLFFLSVVVLMPFALGPDVPLHAITSYLATYNLVAVPVVDADDRLVGAVTVDDVLDHLLPAGWRETDHLAEQRAAVTEATRRAEGLGNGTA